jgi:hypothetical protein
MKKTIYSIFAIALSLHSCSPGNRGNSPVSVIEQEEYLVYLTVDHPKQQQLMVYDPTNDTHTQILSDWTIDEFSLSVNNRLAFSSSGKIYSLDCPFTENSPLDITPATSTENTPFSWSADGHYLLFESIQPDSKKLLLWDGKNILDIYNYHGRIHEVTWSVDGQLAFTEFYIPMPSPDGDSGEVFLWAGNVTVSVSQNPSGEDRFPAWSAEGKLAFLSEHKGEHDILVWDGASKDRGVPAVKTFANIAPDLTQYYSTPTWTNSGSLAFDGSSAWELSIQIYEWDGKTVRNISKNPLAHNGGQTWRSDGYWSFVTYFSDVTGQNVYIRDANNHTILSTKGRYRPAWSQNGLLIFCVEDLSGGWILSLWNDGKIIDVARANLIEAKWQNGTYVYCSYG